MPLRVSNASIDIFQHHGSPRYTRDKVGTLIVVSLFCTNDTDSQAATTSKSLPRKLNAITTISSAVESLLHTIKLSRSNCYKSLTEYTSSQTLTLRQLSDSNSFMSTMTNLQTKQPRSLLQPLSLYLSTTSLRYLEQLPLATMS